jgi:hypothetical protein
MTFIGVPAMAVSTAVVVVGGAANAAARSPWCEQQRVGMLLPRGAPCPRPRASPRPPPRAFRRARSRRARHAPLSSAQRAARAARYALEEIRYASFEGTPTLPPSRAVKLVYGTKDPADVRTLYAEGMQVQSTLRLEAMEMLGPGDALMRQYGFTYDLGPTTKRTRLTDVTLLAKKTGPGSRIIPRSPGFCARSLADAAAAHEQGCFG